MPEIGRPITPQQAQYSQVTMGPRSLSGSKSKSEAQIKEDIINKATGYKPKNEVFKEGPHNQMGKDEFMKLLTFQLQNQDPMNPMDQSKFTGELAQFSQLEQLTNLNKKFDDGNKTKAIEDKFYAASFVGKKVVTTGSTLQLKNSGDPGDVLFKLDGEASKVLVRILDEKNNVMGEIWRDGMSGGSHQLTWDGVALDGTPAVKGNYKAQVKAWDNMGQEVGTKTEATGIVSSVNFDAGEPVLTVNGQKVYLRDVASFHTAETATHEATPSALPSTAPMVESPNRITPVAKEQALNAYSENTGIYD
ncbi:MAG TPA: flagellar hook capping FlgD N-terminal domain-containing protein [Bacteriovoracaceae bacterium]|nr:flagellar hook capping FlgD N-terminal domain-containing protein [Bacteriovoracaceae bacterium]